MQHYWGLRGSKLNAAIWGVACFCIMIFGYNQAVAGGVLTTESFQSQFPQMDTIHTTGAQQKYNSTTQGTVIALYTLTGTFGALACTFLGDLWGRRWTIFAATTVQLIGAVLMGTSFGFAQFIVSRIVLGFGVARILATTPVWQTELSKPHSRGSHVSGFGIFNGRGCRPLFGYAIPGTNSRVTRVLIIADTAQIAFGARFSSSSFSWRFPFSIQIVLSVLVMTLIFTLPESPGWLVKMGRIEEAREIFAAMYDTTIASDIVSINIRDIQLSLGLAETFSLRAMFRMGPQRTFHRVTLAAAIQMYLQLTGVNSITYYESTIFVQDLHFSPEVADILAASSQFVAILGSVVCSFTVDRFGRRPLMLTSATCMVICQSCLAGLVSRPSNSGALIAAAAFVFLYIFVYVLGSMGIPFLYASEVAPSHIRAAVCGVSTAVSWLLNFMVAEITPIAFTTIGYRYFIIYAAINASCVLVVYFFYPETAGRSLEEIDEIFTAPKNILDPVRVAKRLPKKYLTEFWVEKGKVNAETVHLENARVIEQVRDNSQ